MVTLLAKNAVQIKCGFENAIMTGNYECAYALGVLCAISGQQQYENYGNIIELKKKVFDNMGQFSSDDKKIKRIFFKKQDTIFNAKRNNGGADNG